jgi:hypothetical protein
MFPSPELYLVQRGVREFLLYSSLTADAFCPSWLRREIQSITVLYLPVCSYSELGTERRREAKVGFVGLPDLTRREADDSARPHAYNEYRNKYINKPHCKIKCFFALKYGYRKQSVNYFVLKVHTEFAKFVCKQLCSILNNIK